MSPHKWDGPTTCLIFLGIQIDTVAGELRLPEEKLQRLRTLLQEWSTRKSCQRKQLESSIGLLTHAWKVVCPGRFFLRRLLDLLHATGSRPDGNSTIRLNRECRADVAWWEEFVGRWNGRSFLCPPPPPTTSRWWRWHQTHLDHRVVEPGMAVAGFKSPGTTALSPSQPRI